MSAPDTNLDRQKRRHRFALIAIAAAVVFGLLVFLGATNEAVDDVAAPPAETDPVTAVPTEADPNVSLAPPADQMAPLDETAPASE